jgi:hypothetical protein
MFDRLSQQGALVVKRRPGHRHRNEPQRLTFRADRRD